MMMFAYNHYYGSYCDEYSGLEVVTLSLYNYYQSVVRAGDSVYQGACPAGGVSDGNIFDTTNSGI